MSYETQIVLGVANGMHSRFDRQRVCAYHTQSYEGHHSFRLTVSVKFKLSS
jgi:hypothetical protein